MPAPATVQATVLSAHLTSIGLGTDVRPVIATMHRPHAPGRPSPRRRRLLLRLRGAVASGAGRPAVEAASAKFAASGDLQQIVAPAADRRLAWEAVLHHLIRFPPSSDSWERRALALFGEKQQIPVFTDLAELARLVEQSLRPAALPAAEPWQSKREELEERYLRLEGELSNYRYP